MSDLLIPCRGASLRAILSLPKGAKKIVLFAHGSGSGRLSPRNQFVAHMLEQNGLATLLLDLLTEEEEQEDLSTRKWRFDIPLLTKRLVDATSWAQKTYRLTPCYFGASTGGAAALLASLEIPVAAIVIRGGRPDLAGPHLSKVTADTLLIVGGNDVEVIKLNQLAFEKLGGKKELVIIPKATHLFEEEGALEQVAHLACRWLLDHERATSYDITQ